MIPCPFCRSPARRGPCPFCGALVAITIGLSGPAAAQPVQALYGVPYTEPSPALVLPARSGAELETAAMVGELTETEVASLTTARTAEGLRLLAAHYLAKGDDPGEIRVLTALTRFSPKDADLLFKLTLLTQGTDLRASLRWAELAIDRAEFWDPPARQKRLMTLHKLAARSSNKLGDRASATRHAKAFVELATQAGVLVPTDLRGFSTP